MFDRVQKACAEWELMGRKLIDVKDTLDNISWKCLLCTMESMGANGDLMLWTELFMSYRRGSLVIDRHQCEETAVDTSVPQGSPVSPT